MRKIAWKKREFKNIRERKKEKCENERKKWRGLKDNKGERNGAIEREGKGL